MYVCTYIHTVYVCMYNEQSIENKMYVRMTVLQSLSGLIRMLAVLMDQQPDVKFPSYSTHTYICTYVHTCTACGTAVSTCDSKCEIGINIKYKI